MTLRRPFQFSARFGLLAAVAGLAACDEGSSLSQRALAPIPSETVALMEQAGSTKEAPTLILAPTRKKPSSRYGKCARTGVTST